MTQQVLGVDVGGTFTDFVAYDEGSNRLSVWKCLSTPHDPTQGIVDGLGAATDLASVKNIRLGTTVATNAILQRRGGRVAYITTAGFRDIPFLQRGHREHHYDSSWVRAKPLVRRRDCFEITERILSNGAVHTPLDEQSVRDVAAFIRADGGFDAVAVCLLFAYVNPDHERRVRALLAAELPHLPISISFDVLPKWKEYERASTTIADAYIKPLISDYLKDLSDRVRSLGMTERIALIKSNGGEASLDSAKEHPIHLTLSGPTGGVVAAQHLARDLDLARIVTLDMGGTSTDCSTVIDGDISFTTDFEIAFSLPIQVPMIDIRTIGAGGGSIAWVDKGGMLRVGPHSAGASPGPACYGFGGSAPTVTDANLLLGRIDPDAFLGGEMALDVDAARAAMDAVGAPIGMDADELAWAIVQIVNNSMVGALRTVLTERGHDPRDFTLVAFGGAGPLHICELMAEANINRGVVPIHPGQFSALGFTMAPPRVDMERTVQMTSKAFDAARATTILEELTTSVTDALSMQGHTDDVVLANAVEMRYLGQNYELEVALPFDTFSAEHCASMWQSFHDLHERRFGFSIAREVIEVITFKTTATATIKAPSLKHIAASDASLGEVARREVRFADAVHTTPIYVRHSLPIDARLDGPALIIEEVSTTVVAPGFSATQLPSGHLLIEHNPRDLA